MKCLVDECLSPELAKTAQVRGYGESSHVADVAIHAGLVCLNGPDAMDLDVQLELFEQALGELAVDDDLINQVLEIALDGDDELHILRYRLPVENE